MAITPTGLPKRIAPGRTGFTKPAPPKRAPGPYPLPPSPKRAPGPGTPGPLPPPPTPAGPIGQGYLTEFDEGIPQLFRGIPGTIGGGAMGNIDPQRLFHGLSQVGGLRQRAEFVPPPGKTGLDQWLKNLLASGSLTPQGYYWLLNLGREGTRKQPPTVPPVPSF